MISRFFITCLVLCFSAIYTLKAQELVADFSFDDPADLLNNAVDDDPAKDGILIEGDGTAVCEDPVSGKKGLCNTAGNNFDMRIPTELFEGHDNIRIEIEFLNQEQFSQPITANREDNNPEAAPSGFTSFRIFHGNLPGVGFGFRVAYSTTNDPFAAIESEFIPTGVALDERATIAFGYNQATGIARLSKNNVQIWETPVDNRTPGAAFSIGSTNQTADGVRYVLLGNGMNGESSAVPSLLGLRVYDNDCPILPLPTLESTPEELTICGSGTTTLTVSGALDGAEYRWYDANGDEVFDENGNLVTTNTFTTPELTQTTTYSVAISDDPCLGDPLEIQVVVQPIPEAPEVITPAPVCEPSVFTLEATGGTDGNYQWYSVDQNSNPVLIPGANQAIYPTAELTEPTQFFVSIIDGTCESELVPLSATVRILPEAPTADPVVLCQPGEVTLQVNDADEFTYRWYDQPTNGTLLAENDGTFTTTVNATTTFYVSAQSGGCESIERVPLEVSLAERPEAPQSEDQVICEAGPVTFTATGDIDGNYRWYEENSETPIAGAVNGTFSPNVTETTTYYVAVDDGICQSDPTPVTVTILSEAAPPQVDGSQNCSPTAFELVVNNAVAGSTYRWYAADGTTVLLEGPARYTTNMLSEPTDYLVAQIVGDCEGAPTLVRATVYPPMAPPTINPTLLCEPGEAVLQVNAPDNNTLYRWYRSPDDQMSAGMLAENDGTLRLDVADNTTLYVSAWNGTCESERTPVTVGILEAPTIDAGDDTRILPGDRVTLTAPAGFVQYQWSPSEGLDNPNIRQPTAAPTQTTTYYLTVTTDQDCDITSTVTVAVAERLPIPNAFTPNADGLNDTWDIPFLRRYPQSQVLIYNRWGGLVFQSAPGYEKAWDGFYQGSVVPQGTYTYVLDLGDGQKPTRGILTILQ